MTNDPKMLAYSLNWNDKCEKLISEIRDELHYCNNA